jgi:hypothetical protein
MPDPRSHPGSDRSETPDPRPARTEPDRERAPPARRERGPGRSYGNAPGVEEVESWHRESPPRRSR